MKPLDGGGKNKRFWLVVPYILVLLGFMVVMTVFSAFVHNPVRLVLMDVTVTFFAALVAVLINDRTRSNVRGFLRNIESQLQGEDSRLSLLPNPIAVLGYKGEIVWYNDLLAKVMPDGQDFIGSSIARVCRGFEMENVRSCVPFEVKWNEHWYSCSSSPIRGSQSGKYLVVFTDVTKLKENEIKYLESRPTVMVVVFDNEDELLKARENDRIRVTSAVETLLNEWVGKAGICWADARDKSLIILEEAAASSLIDKRFSLLDRAREIETEDGTKATLSIGVGRGGRTIDECEQWALDSLDMALGRGGDQAVVRSPDGYSFFGGVSKSSERQSKVRIRMLASTLTEMIVRAGNVIIMGHRNSDLDAIGAAIGVYSIAAKLDVPAYIAVDRKSTLAGSLINYYSAAKGRREIFIDPVTALDHILPDTLVVVVDTQMMNGAESRTICERAATMAVIDHHRMSENHIDNAQLSVLEPSASSASELVAEMAGYIDATAIGRPEAEALLAGIMLDTKNYVVGTGVRTFEASAFLRRRQADPISVRRLFAEPMAVYNIKSRFVSDAVIHKGCAVAHTDEDIAQVRVAAAQAADDLLMVEGVDASFICFRTGDMINISARSYGRINVQMVMEKLSGGGHHMSAATQIKGKSMSEVLSMLYNVIDETIVN